MGYQIKGSGDIVMANEKQLQILGYGGFDRVTAWNDWREKNPNVKPDLSGAHLINAMLQRVNLSGANLSCANLRRAHLTELI